MAAKKVVGLAAATTARYAGWAARSLLGDGEPEPPPASDDAGELGTPASDDAGAMGPALTEAQADVLRTMAEFDGSRLLSRDAIVHEMKATTRRSPETVRRCVAKLIEVGLAERPEGPRAGARLTNLGRRQAVKIAP